MSFLFVMISYVRTLLPFSGLLSLILLALRSSLIVLLGF